MKKPEVKFTQIKQLPGVADTYSYQVQLRVANQTFNVGGEHSTRREAMWFRRQLVTALHSLVQSFAVEDY
jgi:hypothetical protein